MSRSLSRIGTLLSSVARTSISPLVTTLEKATSCFIGPQVSTEDLRFRSKFPLAKSNNPSKVSFSSPPDFLPVYSEPSLRTSVSM